MLQTKVPHLRHIESTRKDFNESISLLQVNTNNAARDISDDEYLFHYLMTGSRKSINVIDEDMFNRIRDIKLEKNTRITTSHISWKVYVGDRR